MVFEPPHRRGLERTTHDDGVCPHAHGCPRRRRRTPTTGQGLGQAAARMDHPGELLDLHPLGRDPRRAAPAAAHRHRPGEPDRQRRDHLDDRRHRGDGRAAARRHALRPHALEVRTTRTVDGRGRAHRRARAHRHGAREHARAGRHRLDHRAGRLQLRAGPPQRHPARPGAPLRSRHVLRARRHGRHARGTRRTDRRLGAQRHDSGGVHAARRHRARRHGALRRLQPRPLEQGSGQRAVLAEGVPADVLGRPRQAPRLLLGVHRPPAALHRVLRGHRLPVLHPLGLHRPRRCRRDGGHPGLRPARASSA